jgi:hypothetical protein
MKSYTYIDASEYPTKRDVLDQIFYLDGVICEMEEQAEQLLASDDRDDFAAFCDLADDQNDLADQLIELNHLLQERA